MKKENLFLAFALFFVGNTPTIYAMAFNKAENSETLKASKQRLKALTGQANATLKDLDTKVSNLIQYLTPTANISANMTTGSKEQDDEPPSVGDLLPQIGALYLMCPDLYVAAKEVFELSPIQDMNPPGLHQRIIKGCVETIRKMDLKLIKNIQFEIKETIKSAVNTTHKGLMTDENHAKITSKIKNMIEKSYKNNDPESLYNSIVYIYDVMAFEDRSQSEIVVDFLKNFQDNAVASIYTQLKEGSKFRTAFKRALDHFAELSNK